MVFEFSKVSGITEHEVFEEKNERGEIARKLYKVGGKAFLVENKNTLEVRTDEKLAAVLTEKYESVMESRYFGRGGIEIVDSGQLTEEEVADLVRLSYNLTVGSGATDK